MKSTSFSKRNFVSTAHSDIDFELYHANLNADQVFGDEDAYFEWNNKELFNPYETFVHTESYDSFKNYSMLFLLGRRGTGKTSILQMLDYEIKENIIKNYNYSDIIPQNSTFPKITTMLRSEAFSNLKRDEIKDFIKGMWTWVVYMAAMIEVIDKEIENNETSENLRYIHNFLHTQNLLRLENDIIPQTPLDKAIKVMEDNLATIDHNPLKISTAISKWRDELFSIEFREALNYSSKYLIERKKKIVILIDSKEVYEYDDAICSYVSSALIDCALDIYTLSNKTNIHAKVAFASEMYPHLKQDNREKTLGKSLFIMWRYKDILTFIAKRYCNTLKKEGVSVESYNLNKIEEAKAFLAIYFPEAISSYSKINFETISYIIGHTQKKPRQIIQLFNIILNLAKKNGIEYSKLTPTCIREGCNVKLDLLCGGTLDLYSNLFRSGDEIIRKTFTRSNNILSLSDIHKRLKESSGIMQRANVDKERAIRLFLESGLLGRLKAEHPIKRYQNKYIITAEFEYQIKEILTITNNDVLVIHPMFYQPLGILADNNSLVYPYPTDEESEELSLLHSYLNS